MVAKKTTTKKGAKKTTAKRKTTAKAPRIGKTRKKPGPKPKK